jgi:heat shock protein HtpX
MYKGVERIAVNRGGFHMNAVKTTIMMAIMTAILVLIGWLIGGTTGMIVALILSAGLNFSSYWFSDRIVLSLYHAQLVGPDDAPKLHNAVRRLVTKTGLPMPKVYIIPTESANAFATGRNPSHAAVAATRGILRILDDEELEAVLAHELTHVKDRDILVGTIAATLAGAITMLAVLARWTALFGGFGGSRNRDGGVLGLLALTIVAPIAALIIRLAISRTREYMADAGGSRITGNPRALASALQKLELVAARHPLPANRSTAHLFIVNPLRSGFMVRLFSTHPPTEKRVAKLMEMASTYRDRSKPVLQPVH